MADGQTVTMDSFVVVFESVEGTPDEVIVQFTARSSASVMPEAGPLCDEPTRSTGPHGDGRTASGNHVRAVELENVRTVEGESVRAEDDPVGVYTYRTCSSSQARRTAEAAKE